MIQIEISGGIDFLDLFIVGVVTFLFFGVDEKGWGILLRGKQKNSFSYTSIYDKKIWKQTKKHHAENLSSRQKIDQAQPYTGKNQS